MSRRFEVRNVLRWAFALTSLLFIVFVTDEVVDVTMLHNDRQTMESRAQWIATLVSQDESIQTSATKSMLVQFAKEQKVQISVYDQRRQLVFSTKNKEQRMLEGTKQLVVSGHSLAYIKQLPSTDAQTGYLKLIGNKSSIVGLNLFYCFFIAAGVALLLYRDYLVRTYARPIRFATRMAENVLEGSYNMIASDQVKRESILHLNLAMNRISESIHDLKHSYNRQRASMATLTENIGNGLILIDGVGRINYVNQTFKDSFQTNASYWELADYHEVITYDSVKHMIDEVYTTKATLARQLQLNVGIERKYYDVSCAPILNKHNKVRGIVVVFHDITTIKKLEKMRKDFVANVSHELKTPVTSLIGFTETLLDGAREDKELEDQFLHIMLHEGQRLQSLIKDLLELSKIEREHFNLEFAKLSLKQLIESVLLIFKERAKEKTIDLRFEPGDEGIIDGDAFRIRQIMINLVTNAIAYTPEGGKVSIAIHERKDEVDVVITDTGIGIEKDKIPRVFERFYRIDKARSRDSGGTGLGLAIVKHLVEAHEGRIHVESEPGRGSAFTITFKKNLVKSQPNAG
ncbi:two-component system histidine kinase PnpS [Sporolactobacillus terrae]|nr:ATP-binding protein [Sporolactobacillus terrae]